MKFDLAVIVAVQVAALVYGVHTLFTARPVYIAALGPRVDVVYANDIPTAELETSKKRSPWLGPEWVGVKHAADAKEHERVLFASFGGLDYGHYPQHHQPIENMRERMLAESLPISELKKLNPDREAEIDDWLRERGTNAGAVLFQGLKARAQDMAVIIDAKNGQLVGIAPFKPWG